MLGMLIAALSTIAKFCNQARCPSTDEWIKKVLHIHYGVLAIKNEIMSFAEKLMGLELIMLNEIRQTKKDKYHIFSLTHSK
jgi:hypothetical protein